ncbi:DUF6493 family protein [Bacteroides sp. 519]|uniref:DUF6493 family protein n=1 Tax=Bacteroides sp. 519 TaxID=2302937 RepID=UPI0013D4429D|nr:DUF6493 family protein [Bacteroides sp. 519]NDV59777.1 hypothetical protein [Bacteroides sp. 519]
MKEMLLEIIENEKVIETIPFFRKLDEAKRKELAPVVKDRIKYYTTYQHQGDFSEIRGTMAQFTILSIAAFICLDYNDYKRNRINLNNLTSGFIKFHEYTQYELMEKICIDDILEWYCPEWLNAYINDNRLNNKLRDFSYNEIIHWQAKGYITPTPELIVATLIFHPFAFDTYSNRYLFQIEKLTQYPQTLQEHVWFLFQYPSDIYCDLIEGTGNENWKTVFRALIANKYIDRIHVLRECLLTVNRSNLSRNQVNWFMELFSKLDPSLSELFAIQTELFQLLTSTYTKSISAILEYIRYICTVPGFQLDEFLTHISITLKSGVKSIIDLAIDILLKLLEVYTQTSKLVDVLAVGFICQDELIQSRIVQYITAYSHPEQQKAILKQYDSYILPPFKPLLDQDIEILPTPETPALPEMQEISDLDRFVIKPHIRKETKIPVAETFNDFIAYLDELFESEEEWHLFMLPHYVQKFSAHLTQNNINQLDPVLKKVTKVSADTLLRSGLIGRTFAFFMVSYGKYLTSMYPDITLELQQHLQKNGRLDLSIWLTAFNHYELYPFYFLLTAVLKSMKSGNEFLLLSTPTHAPMWIDPVVLIQRLKQYQDNKCTPNGFDMQLALQRCALDNTTEAIKLAQTELEGEIKSLMLYLLNPKVSAPSLEISNPSWWMTATVCKYPHQVPKYASKWGYNIPRACFTGNYSFEIKTIENISFLKLNPPIYNVKQHNESVFLAEYYYSLFTSSKLLPKDITKLITSAPYHHDSIIAYVLYIIDDFSEGDTIRKASVINALKACIELHISLSNPEIQLLAISLFASDKTIRNYAATLWSETVLGELIDNKVLGEIMADINKSGWLSLKNFNQLLEKTMLNISVPHNCALEELLAAMIDGMGDKTVKHLKGVLEIYNQLLSLNETKNIERTKIVEKWKNNSVLKNIVHEIMSKGK